MRILLYILICQLFLDYSFTTHSQGNKRDHLELLGSSAVAQSEYSQILQLTDVLYIDTLTFYIPAKIYIWDAVMYKSKSRELSVFGHVAVGILYDSVEYYLSFYPKSSKFFTKEINVMLPENYLQDVTKRKSYADRVFNIDNCTQSQLRCASKKIRTIINKWEQDKLQYNLMARNCVIIVNRVLSVLGIDSYMIIDPESFEDSLTDHSRITRCI